MASAVISRAGMRTLSAVLLVVAALLAGAGLAFLSASATLASGNLLTGTYEAEVLAPDGSTRVVNLPVPGLFHDAGLPDETRVTVRIPVDLPRAEDEESAHQNVAVYVDRIRHAVSVRWDGATVERAGKAEGVRLLRGRDGSVLAAVPTALARPGPHLLELEVTSAWSDGGILGEVRVGSTASLARLQQWREFERMGLVIVGIFAAVVHLSVAVRRPGRWDHALLGAILAGFALYLFGLSDSWFLAMPDADLGLRLRVRRGALMLALAACVALASRVGLGHVARSARVLMATCFGIALIDVVPPDLWWNALGNRIGDVATVAVALWAGWSAAVGMRARRPGSGALAAAVAAAILGVFLDILVSRGLLAFSPLSLPSQMAVWGTLAASIGLRDTDAHERYETLVTQASDGILRVSTSGTILERNAAAEQILAMKDAAAPGSLRGVVAEHDQGLLREHLLAATRTPARAEFSLRDGRRVEASTTRLEDGALLSIVRDITERRRTQEGLVRAARMESVGQLAGGIAHDFNNVLGGVLGQVSLMRLQYAPQRDLDGRLERLERTLLRATGLCRRLLTLARGGSPARQRLDPSLLVEQALELIRPAVEPSVRLRIDVPLDLPLVEVVPSEMEEVLMNLAVNARDASPPGAEVSIVARREGDHVAFAVSDRGSGVAPEDRERIFEPFYTTKGIGKGTGLGLAVVARVVRDHGGRIRIERAEHGGACFVASVPACSGSAPVVTTETRATPAPYTGSVFVVDDEPLVREAATAVLRHAGCDVRAFAAGSDALRAAADSPPGMLVTDVVMPGIDGLELAAAMERVVPSLRVVLVSGFMPDLDAWQQVHEGRWTVLEKPFRGDDLVRAVAANAPPPA